MLKNMTAAGPHANLSYIITNRYRFQNFYLLPDFCTCYFNFIVPFYLTWSVCHGPPIAKPLFLKICITPVWVFSPLDESIIDSTKRLYTLCFNHIPYLLSVLPMFAKMINTICRPILFKNILLWKVKKFFFFIRFYVKKIEVVLESFRNAYI